MRLGAALLFAWLTACGSKTTPPADQPAPSNEAPAAPDDTAGAAGASDPQIGDQPPAGDQPTGQPAGADRDGDGVRDDVDRCPDDPEDRDGFEDEDGCPEADNDRDGIRDVDDKCPAEPESKNGRQDEDGCPD
jgi:hypothetical protein